MNPERMHCIGARGGHTYVLCCEGCGRKFAKQPERFVKI